MRRAYSSGLTLSLNMSDNERAVAILTNAFQMCSAILGPTPGMYKAN